MPVPKIEIIKFLKNALGLTIYMAIILTIVQFSLSYFAKHSDSDQTGKINRLMHHQIDPEVLILGSSVAEVGINPKIISEKTASTCYNMAIDGTKINQSEFIIDEFLSYTEQCETIVIGMAFFSLTKGESLNAIERFLAYRSNPYVKKNIMREQPALGKKLYNVPFYSYIVANHTYYKNAFKGFKNTLFNNDLQHDKNLGFVPHNEAYNDTRKNKNQLEKIGIDSTQYKIYQSIIKNIKSKNIRPILVIMPMHINGQESFSNFQQYRHSVEELARSTGVNMFDFSTLDMNHETGYFYNNGHLNEKGARVLSLALGDSLIKKP